MSILKSLRSSLGDRLIAVGKRLGGCDGDQSPEQFAALRQRNEFLEAVIEHVPAPLLVRDLRTERCVLINPEAVRFAGFDREQVLGKALSELHPPERAAHIRANDEMMRRSRAPLTSIEQTIDSPCGPRRIISKRVPLYESGDITYVISLVQDVTDIREREADLRKREAELQSTRAFLDMVIENAPVPIIVRDAKTHCYELINRAAEDLMGRSRKDVIGKHPTDLYDDPEQLAAIHRQDRELIEGRQPVFYDEHVYQVGDKKRIVTAQRLPVFDESGDIRYLMTLMTDVTERQSQTRELEDTKAFLNLVIDHVPASILVRDYQADRYVLVNRVAEQMLHCSRDQIIGRTLEDLYPPDRVADLRERDKIIETTGKPDLREGPVIAGGVERFTISRRLPIHGPDGRIRYIVAMMDDVTERYLQTRELKETKAFLDAIVENVPPAIVVRDLTNERCVLANRAAQQLVGKSRDEMIGKTSAEIYPAAQVPMVRRRDRELIANMKPIFVDEHTLESPKGERIVTAHRMPIFDADGKARYTVTVINDVTERSRQRCELEQTKSFLDTVIEHVPVAVFVKDAATLRFVLANRMAEQLYGISREDLIGRSTQDIYPPETAKLVAAQDQELLRTRKPLVIPEQALETPGKGKRIISATRVPVIGSDGEPAYIMTVVEDFTERSEQNRQIRDMKTFLDTVIEHVPVSIVVKDAKDLRCMLVNRATEELYGVSRDKMVGTAASDVYASKDAAIIEENDRALLRGRKPVFIPEEQRTIAGRERTISASRIPVMGEDGQPRYLITVIEDITERRQAQKRIAHLAHHDSLTDLPNRAAFAEHFAATIERAADEKATFAVMCMDLDRFKEINDVFGHAMGDALLCKVAEALRQAAGDAFVGRLGGDEFALVSPAAISPESANHLAETILTAVNRDFFVDEHTLRAGMSIGIAIYPQDGGDTTTLLANADAALYRAKADGRGAIKFFESDMDKKLREHRALAHDLRIAIDHDQLKLYYQPQALLNGTIIGFEALARWHHPFRGFVSPGLFIPIAEENGLILELGEWALRSACREAASWPIQLNVAINVSAVQFRHGDLPSLVHSILLETGLSPSRLELEVTESVLIDNLPRALSILRRLKALGVRIAMDDFGTGYSSLSNLQSFAFDKIKIDRSFIVNLTQNAQSATIVRAVIGLGRGLKVPVVAEGVETAEQVEFLARETCSEIQGYWVGKPLPISDYAELVGRPKQSLRVAS
jgi:diguanylate cyclase (GGDEF)-like protein/PAS domain S-box-containing protein